VAFALSSLVLAGTTLYLASELFRIRARTEAHAAARPAAGEATTIAQTPAVPRENASAIAPPDTSAQEVRMQPATSGAEAARVSRLRDRLDELNDPAARARQVAELRTAMAVSVKDSLQLAQLQPNEVELLLDHMAESMVRDRQRMAECNLTPGCDPQADREKRLRDGLHEMEQAVGVDVVARMNHQDAKLRVAEFNDALPPGAKLSDATVDALATALAEERRRLIDEDDPAPARQRAQDRAAALLTPEQMEIFRTRQARLLALD